MATASLCKPGKLGNFYDQRICCRDSRAELLRNRIFSFVALVAQGADRTYDLRSYTDLSRPVRRATCRCRLQHHGSGFTLRLSSTEVDLSKQSNTTFAGAQSG